jgi:Tol biopolymer transport system component
MKKKTEWVISGRPRLRSWSLIAVGLLLGTTLPAVAAAPNHPELDWQVLETQHFIVQFHQGLARAARHTAQVAEAAYPPVTALYRYAPPGKIRIVLKDYDDYANGAAFFYLETMEIWTTPLDHDFDMRGTTDWLSNVVTHEFTHMISLGAARKGPANVPAAFLQFLGYQREKNRPDILIGYPDVLVSYPIMMTVVPMWFAEGVAQYQVAAARHDRWDSHRDMALRTAVLNNQLLSFDEMGVFSKRGFGNEFVYDHGYGLVRYIATQYGDQALADLCEEISRWHAVEIDGAISKVLGVSSTQLYESWRAAMTKTYQAQVDGLGPLVEGEAVTEIGFSNIHPAYSPDGKRLAYLSTGQRDYGPHALMVRDLASDEDGDEDVDEFIQPGVVSSMSWSPDGERLVYVQKRSADKFGSRQADLFEYSFAAADHGLAAKLMWMPVGMVSGYAPESPRVRRLTRGLRAMYPAHSPDGEHIAFVSNQGSTNNLGLMRADGSGIRYLTDFVDGTELYTPRWSPDGTKLVLSVSSGGQRDVVVLGINHLANGANGEELHYSASDFDYLVATQGTDRDPTWSADGREVIFASDQSGIFNLYAIDLISRQITQITNVVGGALNPSIGSNGAIAFSSYGADGYQIRSIARSSEVPAVDQLSRASGPTMAEHALAAPSSLTSVWATDDIPKGEVQPYGVDFLRTMVMPRLIVDEGRFKAGAYLAASDVLSKQNVFIGGAIAPTNRDRDLFAIYEYRKWRPTMFLEFFHQKKNTTRRDSSEANTGIITGMDFSLSQVSTGLSGHLGKSAQLRLSATYDRYDANLKWDAFVARRDGQYGFNREQQKPVGYTYLQGFGLGATYTMDAVSRRRDREINPRGGRRIYFRYDRMFNYFLKGFDENNTSFLDEQYLRLLYNQFTLDWQEFVGLPGNSGLGLRFYGGWIASDNVDDDDLVNDFFDYHLGGLNFMKGYSFYSLEGRKAAMASITLRVPLLSDVRQRLAHLYIDKVYGALYADIGKAWDDDYNDPDPILNRKGPLRDAGGQLRFDLLSYYGIPTRVQFDVAYGIDEPAQRDPWKYYFTMLFGYL